MTETRAKGKNSKIRVIPLNLKKRKLDEKILSLESVIFEIKDKFSLPEETINLLHSSASKILEELFQRFIKKFDVIMQVFKSRFIDCLLSFMKLCHFDWFLSLISLQLDGLWIFKTTWIWFFGKNSIESKNFYQIGISFLKKSTWHFLTFRKEPLFTEPELSRNNQKYLRT